MGHARLIAAAILTFFAGAGCAGGAELWTLATDKPVRNLTCVSNGFMGVKVPVEGQGWTAKPRSRPHLIAGLWTYAGGDKKGTARRGWRHARDAVVWSEVGYNDGAAWFDSSAGKMENYRQTLDMKRAVVTTTFRWVNGEKATGIKVEIFASRADRHLGVVRYTITPEFDGEVEFACPISSTLKLKAASKPGDKDKNAVWFYTQTAPPGRAPIAVASNVELSNNVKNARIERPKPATSRSSGLGGGKVEWRAKFKVSKGKSYTITKFVATFVDPGTTSGKEMKVTGKLPVTLLASARGLADAAAGQGYDAALKEHIAAWDEIWKTDIVIDGPKEDQLLLRACAYYTIGAVHEDEPYGATACGLTETLYGGGVFGDQEIFVLPAVMVMYPPLAASMLQYRHNVIPMSRDLRKARGLSKGAEYAWDARWDGGEHTSPPYSENRRVTAYVGYAAWRYYLATRDLKWLETVGWPILSETADYWSVRVTYNREKDRYEVHKVMPPTEAPMPTYLVNNNSYTSGYVRMNMLSAIAAAKALGKKPPTKWVEVADKLYLAVDKERKMYRFHDSVNAAKPPHMADVHWMIYPMEHFAGDIGTARVVRDFTGRKVDPGKVTDADHKFAAEVRQAIADYYFAKTRPGFYSLTAGQNAGVYNDLNHREGAYKEFMSWKKSVGGPFYVANEMRGGGNPGQDVFLSGTGAYLTIAVYGLAGMRLRPEGIQFNPLLPDEWKSMTLKNFHFGSGVYDVKITPGDKMKIKLVSGKKDIRIFRLNGKTFSGP